MQGIFLNCSTSFSSISDRLLWSVAHFFRFVRHFWSLGGGSCYQNSVKACPTIQSLVWSQRFWSVEISDVSSPFSNTAKRSKEVWNGYFHEDAETFGDRIRLSSILRNINQRIFRDFCCDAFLDTHTLRLAAAWWLSWWEFLQPEKSPKISIDTCYLDNILNKFWC